MNVFTQFCLVVPCITKVGFTILTPVIFCISPCSNSHADERVEVNEVVSRLAVFDEFRLEGEVTHFQDGMLFSVSKVQEELCLREKRFWKMESVSCNVLGFNETSARFDEESISLSGGILSIGKSLTKRKHLSDLELSSSLDEDLGKELPALTMRKSEEVLGVSWGLLLCGHGSGVNLREWLGSEKWKTLSNGPSTATIEAVLSGNNGKCSIELDLSANLRIRKYIRTYDSGDFLAGNKLPTKETRSRTDTFSAHWSGEKLDSIEISTNRVDSAGQKHSRIVNCKVTKLVYGLGTASLAVTTLVPNGTKVALIDTPQIHAEWRDGKVVKIYSSGDIELLETVRMKSNPARFYFMSLMVVLGISLFSWFLIRRGRK